MRPSAEIIEALGWSLLHFLWQGTAVAFLLWVVLLVTRKCAAQVRYAAAGVAFLGMLGALAVTLVVLWPAAPAAVPDRPHEPYRTNVSYEITAPPALDIPISQPPPAMAPAVPAIPEPEAPTFQERVRRVLPWFVGLWALGVLVFSLRFIHAWVAVRKWRASGQPVLAGGWPERFSKLCARLNVSRSVKLLTSTAVAVPVVIGWLKPLILLPAGLLTGLTVAQLEAVLAHELAHIRRHDYLVNLLQNVVETVCFYHPAVWWVSRQLRKEREHCCDDIAASLTGGPLDYARALATLEEMRGSLNLGLSAATGPLLQRIRRLIGLPEEQSRLWPLGLMAVVALAAAVPWSLAKEEGRPAPLENDSNKGRETIPLLERGAGLPPPSPSTAEPGKSNEPSAEASGLQAQAATAAQAKASPADTYLKAYLQREEGLKLAAAKDINGAVEKLRAAQVGFTEVQQMFPEWQPEIVAYRVKRIREEIASVEQGDFPPMSDTQKQLEKFKAEGRQLREEKAILDRTATPSSKSPAIEQLLDRKNLAGRILQHEKAAEKHKLSTKEMVDAAQREFEQLVIENAEKVEPKAADLRRNMVRLEADGTVKYYEDDDPRTMPVTVRGSGLMEKLSRARSASELGILRINVAFGVSRVDYVAFALALHAAGYSIKLTHLSPLEFRLVSAIPTPASETLAGAIEKDGDVTWLQVERAAALDFKDVKSATAKSREGDATKWEIAIELTEHGAKKMTKVSQANRGKALAIVADGVVLMAPTIMSDMGAQITVSGNFSEADAKRIAGGIPKRSETFPLLELPPIGDEVAQARANAAKIEARLEAWRKALEELKVQKPALESLPVNPTPKGETQGNEAGLQMINRKIALFEQTISAASEKGRMEIEAARQRMGRVLLAAARKTPATQDACIPVLYMDNAGNVSYSITDEYEAARVPIKLTELPGKLREQGNIKAMTVVRVRAAPGASDDALGALLVTLKEGGWQWFSITTLAPLEFRLVGDASNTTEFLPGPKGKPDAPAGPWLNVEREAVLDFKDVKSAMAKSREGDATKWEIAIELTEDGAKKMTKVSQANRGKVLAVVSDGVVLIAPTIMSDMDAQITVSGNFSEADAKRITDGITNEIGRPVPLENNANKERETLPLLESDAGLEPANSTAPESSESNDAGAKAGGLKAPATPEAAIANPVDIMVTKQEVVKVTKLVINRADLSRADLAGDVFLELVDLNEPFFWRGDMKVNPLRNAAERPFIFGLVGTFADQ